MYAYRSCIKLFAKSDFSSKINNRDNIPSAVKVKDSDRVEGLLIRCMACNSMGHALCRKLTAPPDRLVQLMYYQLLLLFCFFYNYIS